MCERKVLCGDCRLLLPTLPSGSVQLVFIDPPYNIGFDYGSGKAADSLPPDQYLSQIEQLIGECVRLLAPNGSLWVLSPERWADDFGKMLSEVMPRRNRVIWRETFGQYRIDQFPNGHRHLFWHVKDRQQSPFYSEEIRIPSQRMLVGDRRASGPRVPDEVWEIPRLVGNAKQRMEGHPCQLPEALLERVVLSSSRPGDLVLDPWLAQGLRCVLPNA